MMNKYQEVKSLIDEETAYIRYLGHPQIKGHSLWWKSPFRNETVGSLVYTKGKGLHDFGSSKHYDVISLVASLYGISQAQALEVVKNDFGISTQNQYETSEIVKKLQARQAYEKHKREEIDREFEELYR